MLPIIYSDIMIFNETRTKKFISLVLEKYESKNGGELFLAIDEINAVCMLSEFLPQNHADVYFFISFLIQNGILQRVRKGKYFFNEVKAGEYL